jgi:hypothetical protein
VECVSNAEYFQDDFAAAISTFKDLQRVSGSLFQSVVDACADGDAGVSPSLIQVIEASAKACPLLLEVLPDKEKNISGAAIWRNTQQGVEVRLLERSRTRPIVVYEHEMDNETDEYYEGDEDDED